jgi:hypothetical protein
LVDVQQHICDTTESLELFNPDSNES